MRLEILDLSAFGPFTHAQLDFSQTNNGLHLIYGPNEAGKSSALRAITNLFYGIPAQTSDNFIHEHKALRIGARISNANGDELTFIRRNTDP